jgi:carbonic anhydrase
LWERAKEWIVLKAWKISSITIALCGVVSAQTWNHDLGSPIGPLSWGTAGGVNSTFATCGTDKQAVGARQTPINIVSKSAKAGELPELKFHYVATSLVVENLGHVVEVVNEEAESVLNVGTALADEYKLVQFHFHTPSEHTIDDKAAEMEVHFVHQNALGELAVVGVMLKVDNSKANPLYDKIFNNAPYLTFFGSGNTASAQIGEINPLELLPEKKTYYTYSGSLTTPPCSEGVHWYVLTEPAYVSTTSVEIYQRILQANSRYKFNNRPIQPLNARPVLVSH